MAVLTRLGSDIRKRKEVMFHRNTRITMKKGNMSGSNFPGCPVHDADRDHLSGRLLCMVNISRVCRVGSFAMALRRLMPLAVVLLAACATMPTSAPNAILAIGDSFLAWNREASIPKVVGAELRRPVTNAATSFARISFPNPIAAAVGLDIPSQFVPGNWKWVIIDGGGNDYLYECFCNKCEANLAKIISRDGRSGEFANLVRTVRRTGARVLIMGYYDPSRLGGPYKVCSPFLEEQNRRLARLARRDNGVEFFDAGNVISPNDLSLYDIDQGHPSRKGSKVIGRAIARAIRAAERRR